jgi:hypothetical protein
VVVRLAIVYRLAVKVPAYLRQAIRGKSRLAGIFTKAARNVDGDLSLLYIIHDWTKDPLFYKSPVELERIKSAQAAALAQLDSGVMPIQVIQEFLMDSSILKRMSESVGLSLRDIQ